MAKRSDVDDGMLDGAGSVALGPVDRAWVRRALEALRAQLVRARTKEMAGSEIYELRTREVNAVSSLLRYFE